jgi:hypothetical protein
MTGSPGSVTRWAWGVPVLEVEGTPVQRLREVLEILGLEQGRRR